MKSDALAFTYPCFATFLSASKLYHTVVYVSSSVRQPVCSMPNEYVIVGTHSPSAEAFSRQWALMKAEVGEEACVGTPLELPVELAGRDGPEKMQRALTRALEARTVAALHNDVLALPEDEERRRAYLLVDEGAADLVGSSPTYDFEISDDEMPEIWATVLGLTSPACEAAGPQMIRESTGRRVVNDPHGFNLQSANLPGGYRDVAHDTLHRTIVNDIRHSIKVVDEPRHIFSNALPARITNNSDSRRPGRRVRLGIIPDLLLMRVHLPQTTNSTVPIDVIGDVKTITRCDSRYSATALRTGLTQRQSGGPGRRPVDVRADAVNVEYLQQARALDRQHNGTAEGARGPVEAALRRYGSVVGFVFGAYGETSKAVVETRRLIAQKHAAANWRSLGAVSEAVVFGYHNRRLRAKWALTAMREMAALRLRRLPYVGREVESGTTMAPEARLAESLRGYGIGGYYR